MSTLSCESFICSDFIIKVYRRKNAVEIFFEKVYEDKGAYTTNSVNVNSTQNIAYTVTSVTNTSSGIYDPHSSFIIKGYRLFICDGFLKCLKKSTSPWDLYNSMAVSSGYVADYPTPKEKIKQSFCHPAAILDHFYTDECVMAIKNAVLSLAKQNGICVPEKFEQMGRLYLITASGSFYAAFLDWLAYPLVREINNVTICKNMMNEDRNLIAPNFEAKNFKQLVEFYYGTYTSKLLEEVWNNVTVGNDVHRLEFADNVEHAMAYYIESHEIIEKGDKYVIETGDKHINHAAFGLGSAIFNTMGFDYFYQAISNFSKSLGSRFHPPTPHSSKKMEFDLTTLINHISSKKIISILFAEDIVDYPSLYDLCRILREYEDPVKIPESLKPQYPAGLTVDFKFKTLKELHDKISTQYTIIKTEDERKPIYINETYAKLHGLTRNGLTLNVPDNTATLAIWGKLLNICVASYGDRAAKGDTLLLGVEKDNKIKYCIEFGSVRLKKKKIKNFRRSSFLVNFEEYEEVYPFLNQKQIDVRPLDIPEEEGIYFMPSISQFKGEYNSNPIPEDRADVENLLIKWVQENKEFLLSIPNIIGGKHTFVDFGQPDQLVVNQNEWDACRYAFGPQVAVDVGNIADNNVANPDVPLYLDRNGNLPVMNDVVINAAIV